VQQIKIASTPAGGYKAKNGYEKKEKDEDYQSYRI
jgi:hypothetical protein